MPYVKERGGMDGHIEALLEEITVHGDLNYAISCLAGGFALKSSPGTPNYQARQDVYGTLCAATAEYYRRVLSDYEDKAIEKNGDIYEYKLLNE